MPEILVLYYSMYGHTETMAKAVAEGCRKVEGAKTTIKRVEELVPDDVLEDSGAYTDQDAPIASVDELSDYDAIIFGAHQVWKHVRSDAELSGQDG